MADVAYFFDKTAIIKRMKAVAGTDKQRLSATATVEANFQQLDQNTVQKIEGVFGQEYVLFVDSEASVKVGDRAVCKETGESFLVKQVIEAELFGIEQFKEVYLTKLNED